MTAPNETALEMANRSIQYVGAKAAEATAGLMESMEQNRRRLESGLPAAREQLEAVARAQRGRDAAIDDAQAAREDSEMFCEQRDTALRQLAERDRQLAERDDQLGEALIRQDELKQQVRDLGGDA